jgi:predicted alpha-1,2-mannosidase
MKNYLLRKQIVVLFIFQVLILFHIRASPFNQRDTTTPEKTVLAYIDPTIGNVGQLLEPTRPTVHLPNQVIRVYPIRKDFLDDQISCFPLTVVSHRLGEAFAIKPFVGSADSVSWNQRLAYDQELEVNRPWYYSVYLIDNGISVEFTPGKKTGIYRFTFSRPGEKSVLLNLFNQGPGSGLRLISDHEINGIEIYHNDIKIFMYGSFSEPGMVLGKNDTATEDKPSAKGMHFPASVSMVEFKYAISFISAEQAKKNYDEEIKNKSFAAVQKNGMEKWAAVVSQIKIEGGTEAQRRSFYTALYRCQERMVDITEDGYYFSGFDKQVHRADRPFYVDDWSWDTYLALHPLRMILHPAMEEDMLQSYVRMYEQSHWMPTFPVLFGDHACMNGFHSSIVFLDAYRKGLRHFDVAKAYEGMRKNATEATMIPWCNGEKTSLDDFYYAKGYFPALRPGEKETITGVNAFEKRQAVAVTLGGSYDDWALAGMARELGKPNDYSLFEKRAMNFKNLWNSDTKFFLPKDINGEWIMIDPKFDGGTGGRDYYDENNGWTYLWQVQENIPELISLMGGNKAFEERLDQLFREGLDRSKYVFWNKFPDATALVGQYSMGNEPSFHIPYLYNFTNAPWKTQQKIRMLLSTWFKDNIFGIPGDEDGGGMSAFVVFSSMGFYPLTPGLPLYTIGSPLFRKITIRLENGKSFTVIANNCSERNKYIQSARLNGHVLNRPWFTHEQLVTGGLLELTMGAYPNKKWGIEGLPGEQ